MNDSSHLRVADADREQLVDELREHAVAGRVASGASSGFWPAWVIGATLLPVIRDTWQLFGPASDLETVHARMQPRHERRLARGHRHRYRGLPR